MGVGIGGSVPFTSDAKVSMLFACLSSPLQTSCFANVSARIDGLHANLWRISTKTCKRALRLYNFCLKFLVFEGIW